MTPQELEFEYDMATMDLQSKRYTAAEEKFKTLALASNSPESWCGLGIAKYGLIMERTTIGEVFYCFEKAKIVDETKASDLEIVIIEMSIEIVKNLYDVLLLSRQSIDSSEVQRTRAAIATMAGAIITARNSQQDRVMATLTSGAFTAMSFNSYVKAGASISEMQALYKKAQALIKNIQSALHDYVKNETALIDKFDSILADTHKEVTVTIPTNKEIQRLEKVSRQCNTWSNVVLAIEGLLFFSGTSSGEGWGEIIQCAIVMIALYLYLSFKSKNAKKNADLLKQNLAGSNPIQKTTVEKPSIPVEVNKTTQNTIRQVGPPPLPNTKNYK